MSLVASSVVDAVISDGWIGKPGDLVRDLKNPAGRHPSATSTAVARIFDKLEEDEAVALTRCVLDAGIFTFFALIDADFKNSGLHASFRHGEAAVDSEDLSLDLVRYYRIRVAPNGVMGEAN